MVTQNGISLPVVLVDDEPAVLFSSQMILKRCEDRKSKSIRQNLQTHM